MRSVDGCECELTADAVQSRLEHAFGVVARLPNDGGQRLKVATYGYVSELVEVNAKPGRVRLSPSRLDVSLMDEAISWPSLIDNLTTRRIVSARSMVNPATERPIYQWQRLARGIGADVRAVKRWHSEGLAVIVAKLRDQGQ